MNELIAFLLPPAIAFSGMRIFRLLLGKEIESHFNFGLRWSLGLALGMLVFTQIILFGALGGINLAAPLANLALAWGVIEMGTQAKRLITGLKQFRFQTGHLWLLLLLPVLYFCWIFGRLSTLEGTLEFDANAFWVFKSKVLYLEQGHNLLYWMHEPGVAYAHWEYPMLVSCLYVLDYGAVGGVDEFVNKVWPFWMVVALCIAILSITDVWKRPNPLPIFAAVIFCFLPATLHFIRWEGGTIPMVFFMSLTAILLAKAVSKADEFYLAAAMITAVGAAMTKFEGMIYAAMWFFVLLPFCWRNGWFKKNILWRSALTCVVSVLPYLWYHLEKPAQHYQSGWLQSGMAAPAATLHRFPQVLFLNIGARFFNSSFFNWQPDDQGHLQWIGQWMGIESFNNDQLGFLPWLLLIILTFSLWQKSTRMMAFKLSMVIGGYITVVALSISCLPFIQNDLSRAITWSGSDTAGRYYYPIFTAWFYGAVVIWLAQPVRLPVKAHAPVALRPHKRVQFSKQPIGILATKTLTPKLNT